MTWTHDGDTMMPTDGEISVKLFSLLAVCTMKSSIPRGMPLATYSGFDDAGDKCSVNAGNGPQMFTSVPARLTYVPRLGCLPHFRTWPANRYGAWEGHSIAPTAGGLILQTFPTLYRIPTSVPS